MIEGDGVGLRGVGGSWKVDQFGNLKNPSDFNKNKLLEKVHLDDLDVYLAMFEMLV